MRMFVDLRQEVDSWENFFCSHEHGTLKTVTKTSHNFNRGLLGITKNTVSETIHETEGMLMWLPF